MAITLTVEDGTGVVGANSYFESTYADTYALAHGYTSWASLAADAKAVAIIQGTAFIDATFPWFGRKLSQGQGLAWPRDSGRFRPGFTTCYPLHDADGYEITGIPEALKKACVEAAYLASQGVTLYQDRDPNGKLVHKAVGSIVKTYQEESPNLKPVPPAIFDVLNKLLAGLYRQAGGVQSARVIRDNGHDGMSPSAWSIPTGYRVQ